jgi:hypothetical protein
MPEPISMLVIAGAVNVLATGQPLTPDAWLSATASILEKLLDRQDTAETLKRIEQQPFRMSFDAGRRLLEDAQRAIDRACTGEDQQSNLKDARKDLEKARYKFIDALVATYTQPEPEKSSAIVNWHLAMVYLTLGNRSKCTDALQEALCDIHKAMFGRGKRQAQPTRGFRRNDRSFDELNNIRMTIEAILRPLLRNDFGKAARRDALTQRRPHDSS